MTKFTAILTADWHVTHNTWRHRPEIFGDALVSVKQIVDLAFRTGAAIIAAGDIFDSTRPSSKILLDLRQALHLAGRQDMFINGNHDKVEPSWMSVIHPGWMDINGETLTFLPATESLSDTPPKVQIVLEASDNAASDWSVFGIPYVETTEALQQRLDELPPAEQGTRLLLVLHQGVDGLVPHMSAELFDGMIPDHVNMVLCGHTHISGVTTIKTKGGREIPLVSPGSLHLCSVDEDPNKKVFLLGEDGSVWSSPLITRRVITADFSGGTEAEIREKSLKIIASLQKKGKERPPEIQTPIVRVIYDDSTAPKSRSIFEVALREAGTAAHVFYKNKAEKVQSELDAVSDNGLDAAFVTSGFDYAKAAFQTLEKDKKVRRLVESILDGTPSQETYNTLKKEFIHAQAPQRRTG